MHIGILQTGHTHESLRDKLGDFDAMFQRLLEGNNFTFSAWDVEHMVFPASIHSADGWLITGSRHGAYEPHAFIPPLESFIREAYAENVPVVGICFGHQIVAQALGGTVVKFPDGWAIGHATYTTAEGKTLSLNAWHQDQVIALPEGAKTLAGNDFCKNAVIAYSDRAFTVQPHPEFDNATISDYVAARRGTGTYPDDRMNAAADGTTRPIDDIRMARTIADFFMTRVAHV
ncbi:MAG: type 1 glutamine amidotransferase [Jannaschia sp.]